MEAVKYLQQKYCPCQEVCQHVIFVTVELSILDHPCHCHHHSNWEMQGHKQPEVDILVPMVTPVLNVLVDVHTNKCVGFRLVINR